MLFLKLILLPFSYAYGSIVWLRNKLFDWKIFKSTEFSVPVISVGNITVGGTGKSPHIQYLIALLKNQYRVATVSRGYKRKTKGFLLLDAETPAQNSGDEPKQFKFNFPDVMISVGEKRVNAIQKLMALPQPPELILLDDAYQHRWVKAGLNILLIDYSHFQEKDYMLPSGTLREFASGQSRADIIIMSKAPKGLSPMEKRRFVEVVSPLPHQKMFFSYIEYSSLVALTPAAEALQQNNIEAKLLDYKILMFTGIANAEPLKNYLYNSSREVVELKFPDHHDFTEADKNKIVSAFGDMLSSKKIMLTTEKDAMRIKDSTTFSFPEHIPLFYIPIIIKFHDEKQSFDETIIQYLTKNK
jgi:tetraacyldisaccharide 4'-kinase